MEEEGGTGGRGGIHFKARDCNPLLRLEFSCTTIVKLIVPIDHTIDIVA